VEPQAARKGVGRCQQCKELLGGVAGGAQRISVELPACRVRSFCRSVQCEELPVFWVKGRGHCQSSGAQT